MNRALVVGCAAYEDPDIAPLRYANRDAARVAQTLRTCCDIEEANLVVLHDDMPDSHRPTRTNLLRYLTRIAASGQDQGILYFFFSGHGFQSHDNSQYLLPIDCVRGAIEDTALRFDSVVRYLGAATAPHVVLFLDACRNVVDAGKSIGTTLPRVDVEALCPPGVVSFCSCRPGEVSYEADGLKSGIFTEALCAAFSEKGRCSTIYELDAYLSAQVPALATAYGKPMQRAHSRVEPLDVQHLEIVSERKRNEWRATTPIGAERRARPVRRVASTGTVIDPLVGVDFGTSYSVVSWCPPDGKALLLPGPDGRPLVPSVVHFLPDLDYLVGEPAVQAHPYRPTATIRHVKRDLGSSTTYQIDGRSITPERAASLILRSLRRNAEESLGTPLRRCVASHPANFTFDQIEALRRAFALADFDVERMVAEPTMAAMLTYQQPTQSASYLVVDLGGGTFDVALVEPPEDGIVEIRTTAGSNEVGGLDFDQEIIAYAERELREAHGWSGEMAPTMRDKLRREAERAKRDLGHRESTTLLLQDLDDGDRGLVDVNINLDRTQFRAITAQLNDEIRTTTAAVFIAEGYGLQTTTPSVEQRVKEWLAGGGVVLLAGQGTKIFTVREQIENLLPGAPILSQYQETAVAHGLGLGTGALTGYIRDTLLLNVLPFGIGIAHQKANIPEKDTKTALYLTVSCDPAGNREVSRLLDPFTTIPTRRSEIIRLDGRPGTLHELELFEIRWSSDVAFGRIPVVAMGNEIELTVCVDTNSVVVFIVRDPVNGFRMGYQAGDLDLSAPWQCSQADASIPLHRLRRVQATAATEVDTPAADTPGIRADGSWWRIWRRHDNNKLLGRRAEPTAAKTLEQRIKPAAAGTKAPVRYGEVTLTREDFKRLGWLTASETKYRAALDRKRSILGADNPSTLVTQCNLARVLGQRGDLPAAEEEYRAVLAAQRRALGENHPDTLLTRHELALVLEQRSELTAAETEYRIILDRRRRGLGEDHPDTLFTRGNLAWVLRERGELTAAEEEYRAVLAAQRNVLGENHPDTLLTGHELAVVFEQRGNLPAAETEYRVVLGGKRRLLGEDNPSTLVTWGNLAWVLRERGELTAAETEYRAVLTTQRNVIGEDHPDTLLTRQHLALVLRQRGDLTAAETEYRAVLITRRRVLGEDHSDTLLTREHLALVLTWRGELTAAETEYRVVLDRRRRLLSENDPSTLVTWGSLAWVLWERGELAAAETEYRIVLDYRRRVVGEDHPDTLFTRHDLALILWQRGDLPAAETEYRAVLTTQRNVMGEDHPDTLRTRHDFALVLGQRGDLPAAETEYRAVLAARRRVLGEDDPSTLITWANLAWVLRERGELAAAETEYRAVLAAQWRVLGEDHPDTLLTGHELALVLERTMS